MRPATHNLYSAWSANTFGTASWYNAYNAGSSPGTFPGMSSYGGFTGSALTLNTLGLTNGANQAASISVGSTQTAPFLPNDFCPASVQGFSLSYAFFISAPGAFNSLGLGFAVSFVDASSAAPSFQRRLDQNGVLVPNAKSITLAVDTYDNGCGGTATPCTGAGPAVAARARCKPLPAAAPRISCHELC
jgi:hypothetical protein